MSKIISIIVPVYNGEKYISRALDSLLNQKGVDIRLFDIICLNDGSRDGSIDILNNYEKKHPKIIRVVDQKNIGVALTRNKGIKIAKGKYVTFLDQDDFYEHDAFSTMLKEIDSSNDYDVIQGGYRRTNTENKSLLEVKMKKTEYSQYIMSAAWGKLHKRSFLLKNNIEFFNNKYGEDIVFTLKEIFAARRVKVIPDYVAYNWFFNEKSVSNTVQIGFRTDDGFTSLLKKISEMKIPKEKKAMFEYYILRTVTYYLFKSGRVVSKASFAKKEKELVGIITNDYPGILNNKYIYFGPRGELLSMRLAIALMVIAHRLRLVSIFAHFYCTADRNIKK